MGLPCIVYNSQTLSFPEGAYQTQLEQPEGRMDNLSVSKGMETLDTAPNTVVQYGFRWLANVAQADLKRKLKNWFQWAQKGGPWTFAYDSALQNATTTSGGVLAGTQTIVVASATGLVIGSQYVIRSKTDIELVKISNLSGTTVTIAEPLNFNYATGSRFRDEFYWAGRLNPNDSKSPIVEVPPLHFNFMLSFMEDVNAL